MGTLKGRGQTIVSKTLIVDVPEGSRFRHLGIATLASLALHTAWFWPIADPTARVVEADTLEPQETSTQLHWVEWEPNDTEEPNPNPNQHQSSQQKTKLPVTDTKGRNSRDNKGSLKPSTSSENLAHGSATEKIRGPEPFSKMKKDRRSQVASQGDQVSSKLHKPKIRVPNLLSLSEMRESQLPTQSQAKSETSSSQSISSLHLGFDPNITPDIIPSTKPSMIDSTGPNAGSHSRQTTTSEKDLRLSKQSNSKRLQFGKFEVLRADDGTLEYFAPNGDFNAVIMKNGSVEFEARTAAPTAACLFGACIVAGAVRKPGEARRERGNRVRIRYPLAPMTKSASFDNIADELARQLKNMPAVLMPFSVSIGFASTRGMVASQLKFLQATEAYRFTLALDHHKKILIQSLASMDARLARIWRKPKISYETKRSIILQLFEEADSTEGNKSRCSPKTPLSSKSNVPNDSSARVQQLQQLRHRAASRVRIKILHFARKHSDLQVPGGFRAPELERLATKVRESKVCEFEEDTDQ